MASKRNLNKPVLNSSNAPGGDVEVSNLPAHKISVRAHRFIMLICLLRWYNVLGQFQNCLLFQALQGNPSCLAKTSCKKWRVTLAPVLSSLLVKGPYSVQLRHKCGTLANKQVVHLISSLAWNFGSNVNLNDKSLIIDTLAGLITTLFNFVYLATAESVKFYSSEKNSLHKL